MSDEKKVMVNGVQEDPIRKVKLPLDIDWEKVAREKQKEGGALQEDDEE